jgi:hypothetical protein
MELLRSDRAYQIERIRYIYSPRNRAWRERGDIINPLYSIGQLRSGGVRLRDKKWVGDLVPHDERPLVFEYCFCMSRAAIDAKYASSLHTHWSKGKIDASLECNHWGKTDYQGDPSPGCRWDWFEFVELTETNSPRFIRENPAFLEHALVPADYRQRRLQRYGHEGHPANRG